MLWIIDHIPVVFKNMSGFRQMWITLSSEKMMWDYKVSLVKVILHMFIYICISVVKIIHIYNVKQRMVQMW